MGKDSFLKRISIGFVLTAAFFCCVGFAKASEVPSIKEVCTKQNLPEGQYLATIKIENGRKIICRFFWKPETGEVHLEEHSFIVPKGENFLQMAQLLLFEGEILVVELKIFPSDVNVQDDGFLSGIYRIRNAAPLLEEFCLVQGLTGGNDYIAAIPIDEDWTTIVRFFWNGEKVLLVKMTLSPKGEEREVEEIFNQLLDRNKSEKLAFVGDFSLFGKFVNRIYEVWR